MSKGSGKENTRKPWGGRFAETTSGITEKLSASIHFDSRMYLQDIEGSKAHARMLNRMGILNQEELSDIQNGLDEIAAEIESGNFEFSPSLEDIHMNIERRLTDNIGHAGKKLHTARSRNDQVALDMRLYLRAEISQIKELLKSLVNRLADLSSGNLDVILPGYTHLQVAQPVRFSHHLLAYAWQLVRDMKRLDAAEEASMGLPLGSGALAGVNYENHREYLREELGFDFVIPNSMDAVSDRDFAADFLYFAAMLGAHLSRFCEEIILWSSSEFGFIRLGDNVTTGSSIMPQKRNPDLAELIRGKSGRLYGNLVSLLTVLKGLPMTYNRDLQEDKEPLFDSIDTVKLSLEGMTEMLKSVTINRERMKSAVYSNFSTATDLADYLSKKGVPFRESHEIVGKIVRHCEETNLDFFALKAHDLKKFSDVFQPDIEEVINPETSTERKLSSGSTATTEIEKQLKLIRKILDRTE
jgi:argininosuccinate lyase